MHNTRRTSDGKLIIVGDFPSVRYRIVDGVLMGYQTFDPPRVHVRPPATGTGTELKKLLSRIGIRPTEGCKCNRRANEMNMLGIEWCEENIDIIVEWLREAAEEEKLPFSDFAARQLIKLAIRRARRATDS